MLGAIIGDIVGSIYERNSIKTKNFEFWGAGCTFTDDTVMTLAVADAILEHLREKGDFKETLVKKMQEFGRKYPFAGYGKSFANWIYSECPEPYNSFGNGSAMRVSACAWLFDDLESVIQYAKMSAEVTHNHPEGIKGAETVAAAVFLARQKHSKEEIGKYIEDNYYPLNMKLNGIRQIYHFDVTCQGTVPQAIIAFLESESFEDAIRNAVSLGGDSDTLAAITGSIAEAYYGIPKDIKEKSMGYLDEFLSKILYSFFKVLYNRETQRNFKAEKITAFSIFDKDSGNLLCKFENDTIYEYDVNNSVYKLDEKQIEELKKEVFRSWHESQHGCITVFFSYKTICKFENGQTEKWISDFCLYDYIRKYIVNKEQKNEKKSNTFGFGKRLHFWRRNR